MTGGPPPGYVMLAGPAVDAYRAHCRERHDAMFGDCVRDPCRRFDPEYRPELAAQLDREVAWFGGTIEDPLGLARDQIECGAALGAIVCTSTIPDHTVHHDGGDIWWTRRSPLLMLPPASPVDIVNPPGRIEAALRTAVAEMGELSGPQRAYAEVAYRLARQLDAGDVEDGSTGLAGVARELRAAVAEVWRGVKVERRSDQLVQDLGKPAGA